MTVSNLAVPPTHTSITSSASPLKAPSSISGHIARMDSNLNNINNKNGNESSSSPSSPSSSVPTSPSTTTPSLFTPIWDYDRFPVGPCVRDRQNRLSLEQHNPFQIDHKSHDHHPRSQSSMSYNGAMIRSASSNSSSSGDATGITAVVGAGVQSRHGSRRGSRHLGGGSQSVLGDINSKLNNINNNHNNSIPPTANSAFALNGVVSFSGSPTSAAYPHNHSNNHLHTRTYTDASSVSGPAVPSSPQEHQQESSPWPTTSPPATMSKFDQYKAQMERYRSTRASSTSLSSSSGRGVISATTTQAQVQTQVPPFTSSFSRTNSASSSPDSNLAKTPGSCLPRIFRKTKSNSSKARQAPRDDCSSAHSRAAQPQPQPQGSGTQQMAPQETLPTSSPGSSSSRSSLLNEKETHSSSFSNRQPSSRLDPEKSLPSGYLNTGSGATSSQHHQQQLSPIKEQQDRWRDEWLRPSGAMHSLFRDRPSKFNCPHCGAIKVVSHIQFVPGVMSYLVAFGLLFLTLGTLSYLPFRKDHEGTKDCIHWCPECGQKVARFNRANTTWEWI